MCPSHKATKIYVLFCIQNNQIIFNNNSKTINQVPPEIYKVIEDLCLDCDLKDTDLTVDQFMDFVNEELNDVGFNNLVTKYAPSSRK